MKLAEAQDLQMHSCSYRGGKGRVEVEGDGKGEVGLEEVEG